MLLSLTGHFSNSIDTWLCNIYQTLPGKSTVQSCKFFKSLYNYGVHLCSYCNSTDITEVTSSHVWQMKLDWFYVALTQVLTSFVCYFLARSAAKIRIQRLAYALPLSFVSPLTFLSLSLLCHNWNGNQCAYTSNQLSGYLFFRLVSFGLIGRYLFDVRSASSKSVRLRDSVTDQAFQLKNSVKIPIPLVFHFILG